MANKRRGKRRYHKNFAAIPFSQAVALATLADDTVLLSAILTTLVEDLYISSVKCSWGLRGLTAGEGPLNVGYAHGDLTVAEVKEFLDAELDDPDDIIQKERASRPVRHAGMYQGLAANEFIRNGEMIKTICKFTVGNDKSFNFWIHNRSGGTLATGAVVVIQGTIFGRWLR